MGRQPRPRLVLVEKERVGEGKENFQLVDVVCLKKNWGSTKTEHQLNWTAGISAVGRDQG